MKKLLLALPYVTRAPLSPAPSYQVSARRIHIQLKSVPYLISMGILLIYLFSPTRNYYWDGIDFAIAIENSSGLSRSLIHPHHLLYNVFGFFIYHLVHAAGWHIRALQVLQITNSIVGASCAGLLFRFLRHTLQSLYLSSILTVLFSFSATWWKYSTDADAYILSFFFLFICLNLVLAAQKPRPLLVAMAHSAGMCLHQLAVFFYPVIVLGILWQTTQLSTRHRVSLILKYSVTASVVTLATYYYCFHLQTGDFNLTGFAVWLTSYLHVPHTYSFSFDLWSNIIYTLRGHARLFFGGRFNFIEGLIDPPVAVLLGAWIVIILVLVLKFIRGLKKISFQGRTRLALEDRLKPLMGVCALWFCVYVVFLFFWYPYFTVYRLFYLPALISIFGIVLAQYRVLCTDKRRWYAALLMAAVALSNFLFFIFPLSQIQKNPLLSLALEMNHTWAPGTVIYYLNSTTDQRLFAYFNPSTTWRRVGSVEEVSEDELEDIYRDGRAAWIETSAIDHLQSTPEGVCWLSDHTRENGRYELVNDAYKIKFRQIFPRVADLRNTAPDRPLRMADVHDDSFSNSPFFAGHELSDMAQPIASGEIVWHGHFTQECSRLLEERFTIHKVLMTPTCNMALDLFSVDERARLFLCCP